MHWIHETCIDNPNPSIPNSLKISPIPHTYLPKTKECIQHSPEHKLPHCNNKDTPPFYKTQQIEKQLCTIRWLGSGLQRLSGRCSRPASLRRARGLLHRHGRRILLRHWHFYSTSDALSSLPPNHLLTNTRMQLLSHIKFAASIKLRIPWKRHRVAEGTKISEIGRKTKQRRRARRWASKGWSKETRVPGRHCEEGKRERVRWRKQKAEHGAQARPDQVWLRCRTWTLHILRSHVLKRGPKISLLLSPWLQPVLTCHVFKWL